MIKGILQVKKGKYYAVISYKDTNDKQVRKWIPLGLDEKGNKRKAQIKLEEIVYEYEKTEKEGLKIREEQLYGDYLKEWIITRKRVVEEITYYRYLKYVNLIANYFDARKITLKGIRPMDIQSFYASEMDRGLTANTVAHYHTLIRKSLQDAYENELVPRNVADLVKKPRKEKFVAEYYNKEEMQKLFEVIKGNTLELVIYIGAYYGLRRSEIVGLKWANIDFENKLIMVSHKIIDLNGEIIAKNRMKTKTSNRTLPLIPKIEEMLIKEKKKQEENKKLFGNTYNTKYTEYVCVNNDGSLIRPNFITRHFMLIQKEFGLKRIRFHDLRHSCASLMLANGVQMKQIQQWLGHSSYMLTADTYSHLDFSSKIDSANTISNVLNFDNVNTKTENLTQTELDEIDKMSETINPSKEDETLAELEKILEETKQKIAKIKRHRDFEM